MGSAAITLTPFFYRPGQVRNASVRHHAPVTRALSWALTWAKLIKMEIIQRNQRVMAEREGFEPSIRFCRILTFQASAFDHSATAPHALERRWP